MAFKFSAFVFPAFRAFKRGLTMLIYCNYVQSLSGHTSPVESVAFDSGEVLVLAGSSSGVIRLWDLEESKSKFSL
jgi:katanin p80 WD40 repeat-containing subunit B1